jgi:hypothetical protein
MSAQVAFKPIPLRHLQTPQNKQEEEVVALLEIYRTENPSSLQAEFDGLRGQGPPRLSVHAANWIEELTYLLLRLPTGYVSHVRLCSLIGVSDTMVYLERRRNRNLDELVRCWQAAWFEGQAQSGNDNVAPSLTIFGLKARAGWRDQQAESLGPDRLMALVEGMVADITAEIPDEAVRARLGAKLLARVSGTVKEQRLEGPVT